MTRHSTPWVFTPKLPPLDDDEWELYAPDDWTQARNIAKANPSKLAALQRLWLIEAAKYNVLPLDDRRVERLNSDLAGRPMLIRGKSQFLFGGMGRLTENCVLNLKNKSHSVTADLVIPESGADGVIVAQGGAFGGWSLYVKAGRLKYCYNLFGLHRFYTEATSPLPAGQHQVRMEFTYDGGGLGKGGAVALLLDGKNVGAGRINGTVPMMFSADETTDVGFESGSAVSEDYSTHDNAFTGRVNWVNLEQGDDVADRAISAEERIRVAMARQ
jgi:arylsulfatase